MTNGCLPESEYALTADIITQSGKRFRSTHISATAGTDIEFAARMLRHWNKLVPDDHGRLVILIDEDDEEYQVLEATQLQQTPPDPTPPA